MRIEECLYCFLANILTKMFKLIDPIIPSSDNESFAINSAFSYGLRSMTINVRNSITIINTFFAILNFRRQKITNKPNKTPNRIPATIPRRTMV